MSAHPASTLSRPPRPSTLWAVLRDSCSKSGQIAFVRDAEGRQLTLERFARQVDRGAAGFYRLGIRPESRVLWQLPTCVEGLIVTIALERLGASQVLASPDLGEADLGRICRRENPEIALLNADTGGVNLAEHLKTDFPTLLVILAEIGKHEEYTGPSLWNEGEQVKSYPGRWCFYSRDGNLQRHALRSRDLLVGALARSNRLNEHEQKLSSPWLCREDMIQFGAAVFAGKSVLLGR